MARGVLLVTVALLVPVGLWDNQAVLALLDLLVLQVALAVRESALQELKDQMETLENEGQKVKSSVEVCYFGLHFSLHMMSVYFNSVLFV